MTKIAKINPHHRQMKQGDRQKLDDILVNITIIKTAVAQETVVANPDLTVQPEDYSLLTDLYELTMSACYVGEQLDQRPASFELFVRHLPNNFGYLIAMGLAQVIEYVEQLHFTPAQIETLKNTGIFNNVSEQFWSVLATGRFTGDIWAVPEGTAVFANQPLLRVDAPLWQAQLIETYLLNAINYQTLVATRAARMRDIAGPEIRLLEFGTRRAFSPQASLWAVRAALAAGLDSTSNVLAALKLGRKPSGTMAHSLVMALSAAQGSEDLAFSAFHRYFPNATLLIDTYDTIAAASRLAERVRSGEMSVPGVRIDSGDLVSLSQQVRELLPETAIFASGDIDEWEIDRLQQAGACIDGYGLGTKLVTGQPVNGVYKLVEIDGTPTMKYARSKVTYPGRKQVFRKFAGHQIEGDRLGLATEYPETGEQPLLQLVVKQGERVEELESLEVIRERTAANVASLPESSRRLHHPISVPVKISAKLQQLTADTEAALNIGR